MIAGGGGQGLHSGSPGPDKMIIEECNSKHRPTCNTSSRVPALSCRRRSIEESELGKEEEFLRIFLIEELRGKRWVASPQKSLLNKDSADLNS